MQKHVVLTEFQFIDKSIAIQTRRHVIATLKTWFAFFGFFTLFAGGRRIHTVLTHGAPALFLAFSFIIVLAVRAAGTVALAKLNKIAIRRADPPVSGGAIVIGYFLVGLGLGGLGLGGIDLAFVRLGGTPRCFLLILGLRQSPQGIGGLVLGGIGLVLGGVMPTAPRLTVSALFTHGRAPRAAPATP